VIKWNRLYKCTLSFFQKWKRGGVFLYSTVLQEQAEHTEQHNNINQSCYVAIHHTPFKKQPSAELGKITNDFKYRITPKLTNIKSVFHAVSNGHCIIPSNYELQKDNSLRFISSTLIMIDIDDDYKQTDPPYLLKQLNDICTGLFYTFSHEIKGNRYRLVFVLDESITDKKDYEILVRYLMNHLRKFNVPVDEQVKNPTALARTGIKGNLINNYDVRLNTSKWLSEAKEFYKKELEAKEKQRTKMLQESMNNPVTYEQLLEMCNAIGHLPTKTSYEITQQWLQVVYALKHCVNMDFIDDQQGYELFNIVSGGESNEKYWNSIGAHGDVTVATIIYYAKQRGYKHKANYSYALKDTPEIIETETIRNKDYIQTETMVNLIQKEQKLLVDSATGSGKTTATVNAFKQLANEDYTFYVFSVPTIVLAEQVAKEHDIPCIKGGIRRINSEISESIYKGKRVFVSTYDKIVELFNTINFHCNFKATFNIVVDEVHKYTEAYNYRYVTIDRLEEVAKYTTSFIGLTGTPTDVLKERFDKQIKIDTGNDRSPLSDFRVFTYDKLDSETKVKDSANILLTSVIRSVLVQTRLIVFINKKERIQTISRLLRKEDIKHAIVTSDNKQSSTYRDIVNNGTINDDIEVILTTSLLSDGITIKNNLDWSCLVVSDRESPIFNPSTIKQISNRFRNQYRYFLMFMRTPNEDYSELRPFNIEADYNYKKKLTEHYVEYLNDEYHNKYDDFIPSNVEKNNGIYYKSTEDNAEIEYNPLYIRHSAMKEKEMYYQIYRNAFIKEVSRLIGKKETGIFNVNEELKKNNSDLTSLLDVIEEDEEEREQSNEELRNNFTTYFTNDVYLAILYRDDIQTLEYFKDNVHSDIVSATFKNAKISTYETCLKVGQRVKRRADINSYYNDIESLTHVAVFNNVSTRSITKSIYMYLLKNIAGTVYVSSALKEITEKELPKKIRVNKRNATKKDIKGVMKMFDQQKNRSNGLNFTTVKPLSIESVAEKYGISTDEVKKSIVMYAKTQPKQRQKVMLDSIKKEYGISL